MKVTSNHDRLTYRNCKRAINKQFGKNDLFVFGILVLVCSWIYLFAVAVAPTEFNYYKEDFHGIAPTILLGAGILIVALHHKMYHTFINKEFFSFYPTFPVFTTAVAMYGFFVSMACIPITLFDNTTGNIAMGNVVAWFVVWTVGAMVFTSLWALNDFHRYVYNKLDQAEKFVNRVENIERQLNNNR